MRPSPSAAPQLSAASTPVYPPAAIYPMKSRRRLLFFFAFILALWLAMMLVMYFGTVYPQRHRAKSPASAATLELSEPR